MQTAGSDVSRDGNPELESVVAARTRELSAFLSHLQAISEKEKSELARKLHDELGGLLTAAKMDLSWLQSRLKDHSMQERLSQLGGVLDEAMALKRQVVEDLRPSLLDHFGLATALRAYVESTCAKAHLMVQVVVGHTCEALPRDTAIALFRIVQEGLANIIRHAAATRVRLELDGDDGRCIVILSDDGHGFDPRDLQDRESHGLMGARQRVRALGGLMEVSSRMPGGTTLRVEVPVAGI